MLAVSAIALLLPLAPVACTVIAGRTQYARHYWQTIKQSARTVWSLHQANVIARNIELALAPPAASHHLEGNCTHCGRCCLNSACVFLTWTGDGQSRCSIHNNWFWKLTSCGSYPIDAKSIEVYDCPSFKAIPIRMVARQAQSTCARDPKTL